MKRLLQLIDDISKWGTINHPKLNTNVTLLEKQLVDLYQIVLNLDLEEEEKLYPRPKKIDYKEIRQKVSHNFPSFGFYHSVLNPLNIIEKAELGLEDAVDDLTDIILDLLEINWRFENNSKEDALWHLKFMFNAHFKDHLLNLLKYLQERENE